MAKYKRIPGGEKNDLTGLPFNKSELERVCDLYIEIDGKGIHENNPKIHNLANELNRTVRSVENQLLGFRAFVTQKSGRTNYNSLIPKIWEQKKMEINLPSERSKFPKEREVFDEFKFRISSQLKTILGKNLITDDFVAVFELVKNSFDAHAKDVKIIFEKDKIIIWDNGKGMDRRDIIDKWLFIAYSAKNEGLEDAEFEEEKNKSYRDRINPNRSYAGQKGIGRMGSDRLGSKLQMTTRKITDSIYWTLKFDWDQYEDDALDEFDDIKIDYKSSETTKFEKFENGLILEISNLRNVWPRKKILDLKKSLARLINPFSIQNEFNIEIVCPRELEKDNELKNSTDFNFSNIVNGKIKNFVFEALNIATTQIKTSIIEDLDQEYIETELIDRGNLIYKIREPNKFNYIPLGSNVILFYLNTPAKASFTKIMGITSSDFGSIFLFNNGFRILPFGEPNNDPFNINRRKAQGRTRFLGTRELIGQVSISKNTEQFQETSSRDGGLIDSPGTKELESFFIETLRKLESFVEPILWKIKKRTGDEEETFDLTAKNQVLDFVEKISGKKDIQLTNYSDKLLTYITENIEEKNLPLFEKLRSIAIKAGDKSSLAIIDKEETKYQQEVKRRIRAEEIAAQEEERRIKAEEKEAEERRKREEAEESLKEKITENLFLKSVKSQDFDEIISFLHHIGLGSINIDNELKLFIKQLRKGKEISKDQLIKTLEYTLFENRKILTISKFASKANFKLFTSSVEIDAITYLYEYIKNILGLVENQSPKIIIDKIPEEVFLIDIKPIELNIIVDNLISNSRRARAENINIILRVKDSYLEIRFIDDGVGIDPKNVDSLFDLGYTTTSGSGIGLYHLKKIMSDINGSIEFNAENKDNTEFIIKIKK